VVGKFGELAAAWSAQKVLVFSPHPDDESIAVGGYGQNGLTPSRHSVTRKQTEGVELSVVCVTEPYVSGW